MELLLTCATTVSLSWQVLNFVNISNVPYLTGGTQTSVGLNTVESSVFNEANGMRPLSQGIPRVLVVITDGQVTTTINKNK